jgi:hypothetical protein
MAELPPDLDRLGRALTHAAANAAARRNARLDRRKRLIGSLLAGLLVFATMTPTHLGPADKPDFLQLSITSVYAADRCDIPRGQRFHYLEACNERAPQPQAAR